MMGRKEKLVGDEWDMICWRGCYLYLMRAGAKKKLKRNINHRARGRERKQISKIKEELNEN